MRKRPFIASAMLIALLGSVPLLGAAHAPAGQASNTRALAVQTAKAAGTAHCSSLSTYRSSLFSGRTYIEGSCRPAHPRPGARIKLRVECHVTGWRNIYVTLHQGRSFRVDSRCGGWGARDVTYSPSWVG